ncbi:MAG: RNA-binding protein [Proteobacteria bacterium]|nr:RNA-binding protein [Pseudomonadota bacterium]
MADSDPRPTGRETGARGPGVRERGATTSVRRCIASGELRPKAELIRFVADPGGTVVPDLAGRLPGRGLWLSPRREHLERACARNLFAKAAKAPLRVPEDLPARVEKLLSRRCLELIGLAKRAGQAVSGYQRVASLLASGGVAVLLAAVDAAEDGRRKLRAAARTQNPAPRVVEVFTAEELGRALGQAARAHVAIAPGGFAERLAMEAARLSGLRGE